ncbi:MAG: hypothetical protein JNG88_15030 [Phycisphaerales bacterium]|nr:hypothetical protein [Phycisphaerales bacterium]
MLKKVKFALLTAITTGTLFHTGGCLGGFWNGFFNDGFPTNNRWINVALDVLNEELFG